MTHTIAGTCPGFPTLQLFPRVLPQGSRQGLTEEDHARVLVGIAQVVARHGGPDEHRGHKDCHHCHLCSSFTHSERSIMAHHDGLGGHGEQTGSGE